MKILNKIKEIIINHYDYIIFFCLSFFCLSFLIFQKDAWGYIDAQINLFKNGIEDLLFLISNNSFFGIDNIFINSIRGFHEYFFIDLLKNILPLKIASIVLYFLFLFFNFYFSKKLLNLFFNNKFQSFLGAVFFTFNPVSLYYLNLPGYIFNYSSLIIFFYSLFKYFTSIKIEAKYLLGLLFGVYFMLSYPRTAIIYFIIIFLFSLFFVRNIFEIIKKRFKRFILLFFILLFFLLPQINYFYFQFKNKNEANPLNYQTDLTDRYSNYHNNLKNNSFIENITIKEILNNFAKKENNSNFFNIYSFLFIFFIFSLSIYIYKKIEDKNIKKVYYVSIILFVLYILLKNIAFITTPEIFKILTYKLLLFITNNIEWADFFIINSFIFLIPISYKYLKNKKIKILLVILICFYIFLSISPLLYYKNNTKLKTLNLKNIPENYSNYLLKSKEDIEGSLYFPATELKFSWIDYAFFGFPLISDYKNLFNNNPRMGSLKEIEFSKTSSLFINKEYCKNTSDINCLNSYVYNCKNKSYLYSNYINSKYFYYTKIINLKNYKLFGLKNIILFKDIENVEENKLDFFNWNKDYSILNKKYYYSFKTNKDLNEFLNKEEFSIFKFNDSDSFNFLLYIPQKIEIINNQNIFSRDIKSEDRPVVFEEYKNLKIDSNNIKIEIKQSKENQTKYFVKASNLDNIDNFLLQFNKIYSNDWVIKFINKDQYEKNKCIDEFKKYEVTENKFCNYKYNIKDLFLDYKYLSNSKIENIKGNYIGNTFIFNKKHINQNKNDGNFYFVIYFQKQLYYFYSMFSQILVILIVLLFNSFQCFKKMIKSNT